MPGTHAAQRWKTLPELSARLVCVCPGLVVSPDRLFQNGIIQRQIRHQFLQPAILFFQLFELPGLVCPDPTEFFAPSVVGLFTHVDLFTGFSGCLSLA